MTQSVETTEKKMLRQPPLHVYLVLLAGMFSVSFAPILVRYAQSEQVPSVLIAASRLFFAATILTPPVFQRHLGTLRRLEKRDLVLAISSGIFLALHFASWVTSLEFTSVLISTVIVTSSPIWVAIMEAVILRAKLPRLVGIGLIIAISGGILISFSGDLSATEDVDTQNSIIGAFLSLIGAICVSVYLLIGRKLGSRIPLIPYIWMVYGCAGLILMAIALLGGTGLAGYSTNAYLALAGLVIFPQLIGHSSLNYAVKFMPATIVSMVTQMEPIGSSILAFLIFSELPLPIQIIGSGIILLGVILANIGHMRQG